MTAFYLYRAGEFYGTKVSSLVHMQLQYSKIKLVDQLRSASVCDNVINLANVMSRLQ